MPKQKITISLDSEIAKKLRLRSIEKYGDARSMSRLIEDLATCAVEGKKPVACSLPGQKQGLLSELEADFKKVVEEITTRLSQDIFDEHTECNVHGAMLYFALKEASELKLNDVADEINECSSCYGIDAPIAAYPEAGRNFEILKKAMHWDKLKE